MKNEIPAAANLRKNTESSLREKSEPSIDSKWKSAHIVRSPARRQLPKNPRTRAEGEERALDRFEVEERPHRVAPRRLRLLGQCVEYPGRDQAEAEPHEVDLPNGTCLRLFLRCPDEL